MPENSKINVDNIIDKGLYQVGKKYSDSLKIAIKENEEFIKSFEGVKKVVLKMNQLSKDFGKVKNHSEFINKVKEREQVTEQVSLALKEQDRVEKALIRTIEQNKIATESTNRALVKEREQRRLTNQSIKKNLTFMGRLTLKRDEARKSVQEFQAQLALGKKLSDQQQRELRQSTKEFDKYDKAVRVIKQSTNQFQENVGNNSKQVGILANTFRKLLPAIGIVEGFRIALNFSKEALVLARQAKGVEFAFKGIEKRTGDAHNALLRVKDSTRGLLSDLDIKKAIVELDNFNISTQETDTLLEFLAVRSAQTGQSIDKLRDSLVEGLSKESKLRIDNLGISAQELNEELEKTPNFVEAVANIAKKEIAEAGNILDEASNSQEKFNAAFENFKLKAGDGFIGRLTNQLYELGTAILTNTNELNKDRAFVNYFKELKNSADETIPLYIRQGNLTKELKDLEDKVLETREKLNDAKRWDIGLKNEETKKLEGLLSKYDGQYKAVYKYKELLLAQNKAKNNDNKNKVRDIEFLKEQITLETQKLDGLTKSDKAKASSIQKNIKNLRAEIQAILGLKKATKSGNNNQVLQDSHNLLKAQLQTEIDAQKQILDNESETLSKKQKANLDYFEKKKELLEIQRDFEVSQSVGKADKIKQIEVKFNSDLNALKKVKGKIAIDLLKQQFDKEVALVKGIQKEKIDAQNTEIEQAQKTLQSSEKSPEDVEAYHKQIAEIKKRYALEAVDAEIKALNKLLEHGNFTNEQRKILSEELKNLKILHSNIVTDQLLDDIDKVRVKEKERAERQKEEDNKLANFKRQKYAEYSNDLGYALDIDSEIFRDFFKGIFEGFESTSVGILTSLQVATSVTGSVLNSIYDANIENIDRQIEKNEEYYSREIELATGDERQQDLLREQQEKKRQALEKKKRKEQEKQAKYEKANAVFSALIATALAIAKALPNIALSVFAGITGALQVASILAKPIPKYAKGTKDHKGGFALVGEERPEVIKEPNKPAYIIDRPSILDLPRHTVVTPSLEEYEAIRRASILSSLELETQKARNIDPSLVFNANYGRLIELEKNTQKILLETQRSIEKLKHNVNIQVNPPDYDDIAWRMRKSNLE